MEPQIVFTFRELGRRVGEPWNKIARLYRASRRALHLDTTPPEAEAFLRNAAARLSIPRDMRGEALAVARGICTERPTTVGPVSVAAATAWELWYRHLLVKQAEFVRVFGITEVSLRAALKELGEEIRVRAAATRQIGLDFQGTALTCNDSMNEEHRS
ncbi:MAG: hypothetical protein ACRD6W_00800 [Nitrososphaerales archaeon]